MGVRMGGLGEGSDSDSEKDDDAARNQGPWARYQQPPGATPNAAPADADGSVLAAALFKGSSDTSSLEGSIRHRHEVVAGRRQRRRGYDEAEAQHVLEVTGGLRQPAGLGVRGASARGPHKRSSRLEGLKWLVTAALMSGTCALRASSPTCVATRGRHRHRRPRSTWSGSSGSGR